MRYIMRAIILLITALGVVAPTSVDAAARPAILLADLDLAECGDQTLVARFKTDRTASAVVTIDGRGLVATAGTSNILQPIGPGISSGTWETEPFFVGGGAHELIILATISGDDEDGSTDRLVQRFYINGCDDGGSGDQGGEEPPVQPREPRVLGVTTVSSWNRLAPLNSIFRLVCDRDPTFAEWEYWANRLLDDNLAYDELLGAIQWHVAHGRSVGS